MPVHTIFVHQGIIFVKDTATKSPHEMIGYMVVPYSPSMLFSIQFRLSRFVFALSTILLLVVARFHRAIRRERPQRWKSRLKPLPHLSFSEPSGNCQPLSQKPCISKSCSCEMIFKAPQRVTMQTIRVVSQSFSSYRSCSIYKKPVICVYVPLQMVDCRVPCYYSF